jgi:hypothetical protein
MGYFRRRVFYRRDYRRLPLARLFDERTAEERRCALVLYDCAFALWQEWHAAQVRAKNIRKLRAAVERPTFGAAGRAA